jgi:hypothetical protein
MTISDLIHKLNRDHLQYSSDAFLMAALDNYELPDEFIIRKTEGLGPDAWLIIDPEYKDHPMAGFRNRERPEFKCHPLAPSDMRKDAELRYSRALKQIFFENGGGI